MIELFLLFFVFHCVSLKMPRDDVQSLKKECGFFHSSVRGEKTELGRILMELEISISMPHSLGCPSSFC